MKDYDYYFFDLDGTLIDSSEGIIHSIQYAIEKMEIPVSQDLDYYLFIGPPIIESFQSFLSLDEKRAREAISLYRECFKDKGIVENKIYDGMVECLSKLKESGKKLAIATSKPEIFAKQIVEFLQLEEYFDGVFGATLDDGVRSEKADVIGYAMENLGVNHEANILMIGDRKHDILGAKENNLDSAGVLWGFGSATELETCQPDYILSSPLALLSLEE
ncbi:phosphoglycolate phosphatase [Pilibacter termitis]|uniref:Phosphoglycolate phosphatase n=1 Tax=Pilibacter termitis TaxID=263852 RepID=A0A1T4MXI7_9ENTE|nr:HAD hydrolase-like protein [Pilibacter termitis]SJZ71495.1 phosphoglycolate phosphatase [Pilibacter termitis]